MTLARLLEQATQQIDRQQDALRLAREAVQAGDQLALALCLSAAARVTTQCAYTLYTAVEVVSPQAREAAKSLPTSKLN